jgi:hypothetical protein
MFGEKRSPVQFQYHGGLTPAAPVSGSHRRRTVRDFRRAGFGSPTHGGLTPAALGAGRTCAGEMATFAMYERTSNQERGA